MRLSEAFKALDALNEDTFSLSDDGIKKLAEFENNDDLTDELSVIDLDAETEDDIEESYVGKVILDCCVCHSKLYKDKSDIEIDEESQLANVGEDCPYCYTPDGFKIIGEVATYNSETVSDENEDNKDSEDTTATTENDSEDTTTKDDSDENKVEESLTEAVSNNSEEDTEDTENLDEGIFDKFKKKKSSNEEEPTKTSGYSDDDYIVVTQHPKTGTYHYVQGTPPRKNKKNAEDDMKYIDRPTNNINGAKHQVVTYKDAKKMVGKPFKESLEDILNTKECENITESVNNVNVETDDQTVTIESDDSGKLSVTTEPKGVDTDTVSGDGEMIVPVSDETENEILNNENTEESSFEEEGETFGDGDEVNVDIEDFDEESFDDLGEQYFKEAYNNVETFRTLNVTETNEGLLVEGVIKFTSGNDKKTSFIFESHTIDKDNKVKFIGENKELNTGKGAFTVTGKINENKLIVESLHYNYESKNKDGNVNRISGLVKRG